jgi:acyl-CoA synthetase (AMP-forming)/AMP-acid ligase II
MPVIGSVALPCERSSLQPDDTRFTLIDHEQDWAGFAESLTWSQLYRRTLNVTEGGTPLVNYGVPRSLTVCTVDPLTRIEGPPGTAGEIWPHGRNIAIGYRRKPQETEIRSVERLAAPSAGTREGPWLRTWESGFFPDDELFIIGHISRLLIVELGTGLGDDGVSHRGVRRGKHPGAD